MARQNLSATISIGSVLQRSVGKHLNIVSKGLERVGNEISAVGQRQKELAAQRRVLIREGRSVEDLDREYADLVRTLEELRRRQERYRRASEASARAGASFGRMAGEIGGLARDAAIGVGLLAGAVAGVTAKVASSTEETNRWAQRLGVTTEFLSQMQYAGAKFGVESDALIDGMKELSLRTDEFAVTGKGSAADAFERIGISMKEAGALSNDTAALFSVVRDRMSAITDVAARQRIADELFGGTGAEQMIELLSASRAEVEALGAEAQRAGAVVTTSQASMARDYTQQFNRLGEVLEGLVRTVAVEVMPKLTEVFTDLADYLIDNGDRAGELGRALAAAFDKAIPIARDLLAEIGDVAGKVLDVTEKVAGMLGGWENFGTVIGLLFASPAILSIGAFAVDVFSLGRAMLALAPALTAVGAALIANPIGATLAVIALAALAIITNWDTVKAAVMPVLDWLGEKFAWLMDQLQPLLNGIGSLFSMGEKAGPDQATAADRLAAERGGQVGAVLGMSGNPGALPRLATLPTGATAQGPMAGPSAAGTGSVTHVTDNSTTTIKIDAKDMNADQLMDEIERRIAAGKSRALYDGASGPDQFGGAYE
jgi:hypothetical protein